MQGKDDKPRKSMKQTIVTEHKKIDKLFAETLGALQRNGEEEQVRSAFATMEEALAAHFGQEEHLYYPAIWALRPEQKSALLDFIKAHDHFRTCLAEIGGYLKAGSLRDAKRGLEEFERAFALHEAGEEKLIGSIEQECTATGQSS